MAARRKGKSLQGVPVEGTTVRFDLRLKFAAELAARKQRRTLSSLVEWALEEALKQFELKPGVSCWESAQGIWDIDEADRIAKLALGFPELLNYDEARLWKLIAENGALWRGSFSSQGEWEWKLEPTKLRFDVLREYWEVFKSVASGAEQREKLPAWEKNRKPEAERTAGIPGGSGRIN